VAVIASFMTSATPGSLLPERSMILALVLCSFQLIPPSLGVCERRRAAFVHSSPISTYGYEALAAPGGSITIYCAPSSAQPHHIVSYGASGARRLVNGEDSVHRISGDVSGLAEGAAAGARPLGEDVGAAVPRTRDSGPPYRSWSGDPGREIPGFAGMTGFDLRNQILGADRPQNEVGPASPERRRPLPQYATRGNRRARGGKTAILGRLPGSGMLMIRIG
jgi:hypothetical protein